MDSKNWWKELRNNKAFQVFKRYLHNLINQLNEREIQKHMYKKGLNIDDILIEESSKEIDNYLKIKTRHKKHNQNEEKKVNKETKESKRDINLLYMCLLKFNGLLRYMYFQGLNYEDIYKMAHFIKHTFRKKGQYIFRQFDKSDSLYGVIRGKAVIRLIDHIDYTKKFMNEATLGNFTYTYNNDIQIQYFMSDCEEETEEEEEESSDDNNKYKNPKNKNKNKKAKIKNKNLFSSDNDKNDSDDDNLNPRKKKKKSKTTKTSKKDLLIDLNLINNNEEEEKIKENSLFDEVFNADYLTIKKEIKKDLKKEKKKKKKIKEKKIIKALKSYQTPKEPLKGKILDNFIKEFEYENFELTNGRCFGEWGLLYSIPRTTSIYASEDTDLFYLEKDYFNKLLLTKFLRNDKNKINFLIHKFPIFKKDFKIRHIFTKIIPLFVNKDNIIYTPFDKAENIYLLYQGEGLLVNLPKAKEKEDYSVRKSGLQIISRLQEGAIAGIESCINDKNKYDYGFIINKDFTTLLQINIKYISNLYKDFNKSLIPLYKKQQLLYKQIRENGENIKMIHNLKKRFSLSKVVNNILIKNSKKKRNYSNDFKYNEKIIKFLKIKSDKKLTTSLSKKTFLQSKFNSEKSNILLSNKYILDNLSTNIKTNISPLSSERGKYDNLSSSSSRNNFFLNKHFKSNSQFDTILSKNNSIFLNCKSDSTISIHNKRIFSPISKEKAIKINQVLRKKLISFQSINTGHYNLPLLSDNPNFI